MKKFLAICMMICLLAVSVFAASDPFDTVDDAVAASGLKPLQANVIQDSIYGSESFANEECYNLFDDDVTTKFCTGTFPLYATWQMDKSYVLNGVIFATANDNSGNPGRNPDEWTISGSNDESTWEVIASGTWEDFEDVDYTYFTVSFENDKAFTWYQLDVPSTVANCFQVSELVPCGAEAAAAPAEVAPVEEAPVAEEAPAEVAPAEAAPEAPAAAPATFDVMSVVVIAAAASLIAALAMKKRAVK
jgi:3-oxoacyl-[acyl-carrier protein] reductase